MNELAALARSSRHALVLTGLCLEKVETHRFPCIPEAYRAVAIAAKHLFIANCNDSPEFRRLMKSSPPLADIFEDLCLDRDIRENRLQGLAQVIRKAKKQQMVYPDALRVIVRAQ